jgi:hypothetical protein
MVQPKYNPQEALERAKLLMKYDSSKTLTENKQQINEWIPILGLAAATVKWIVGSSAVAGLGYWINNSLQGGDSFQKTKAFFQGCSKNIKGLKPLVSQSEYRMAADMIYNAITRPWYKGATDLDSIKSALLSMPTVADLCALNAWYAQKYGDLYDDLDSDIDGQDFVTYVWSAIADQIYDAQDDLNKVEEAIENQDGNEDGGAVTPAPTGSGYSPCSGTYQYGCYAPAIEEVQRCLGLVDDGKFGPKTQAALKSKGFTSFTDADINKICEKTVQDEPTDEFDTVVDAEDVNDILNL